MAGDMDYPNGDELRAPEPEVQRMAGEIDLAKATDEEVVKAAMPRAECLQELERWFYIAEDGESSYGYAVGNGDTPDDAWHSARQHPTVVAFERANRPLDCGHPPSALVGFEEGNPGATVYCGECNKAPQPHRSVEVVRITPQERYEKARELARTLVSKNHDEGHDEDFAELAFLIEGLKSNPQPQASTEEEFEKWWLSPKADALSFETFGDAAEAAWCAAVASSQRTIAELRAGRAAYEAQVVESVFALGIAPREDEPHEWANVRAECAEARAKELEEAFREAENEVKFIYATWGHEILPDAPARAETAKECLDAVRAALRSPAEKEVEG